MLAEIAAEVIQFLTRRDLDKARAISNSMESLIEQVCAVHPFRSIWCMSLERPANSKFVFAMSENRGTKEHEFPFHSLDDAMPFIATLLRQSYIESFHVSLFSRLSQPQTDLLYQKKILNITGLGLVSQYALVLF